MPYKDPLYCIFIQPCASEPDDTDPDRPFDPIDIDRIFIFQTFPDRAEFWGVYGRWRYDNSEHHIVDFPSEHSALEFARHISRGRPINRETPLGVEENI